jgi:hypothetical protein
VVSLIIGRINEYEKFLISTVLNELAKWKSENKSQIIKK